MTSDTSKRHKFTPEDCQRGGWSRARQRAEERKEKPTQMEARVRSAAKELDLWFFPEFEIFTGQYPQWVDLWVLSPYVFGIEVDGSHSWHSLEFQTSKMYRYDLAKMRWFQAQRIPLLAIHRCTRAICKQALREWLARLKNNELQENFIWEFGENDGQLKWIPVTIPEDQDG